MTGATHSRELITVQMPLYTALKMLHKAFVQNDEKYLNLLMQNTYYIVPIINVDGVSLIEKDFQKSFHILNQRKNMNPNAIKDKTGTPCQAQMSGVDLNRNWGVDFGVAQTTQIGLNVNNRVDECADSCGECYRGTEPFSEPETRAIRDFLKDKKDEIKFVYNFHSNGNMWIYPFNGRDPNDIADRAPFALLAFQEIGDEATFPEGMNHDGNAKDIIGERIGGDCDDYILSEFRIPSVTAELGREGQYIEEWQNKNNEEAQKICEDNSDYLEFTYAKIGAQLKLTPVQYQIIGDKHMRVFLNVTNIGLSDFNSVPKAVRKPSTATFLQTGDWIFQDAWAQLDSSEGANGSASSNTTVITNDASNQTDTSNQTDSSN